MTQPPSADRLELEQELQALRARVADLEAQLGEEPTRHFLYKLPQGFEEIDFDGRVVWCNPAREQMLGESREDIVGSFAWDRMPSEEEARQVRELIERLARELPPPEALFLRARHRNGSVLHLRADWDYRRDAQGTPSGFFVLLRDISEEAETKLQLEKSLKQFQDFMSYFPGAAFMKDRGGRYLFANPLTAEVLGLPPEELIGKTDHDVLPRETADLLRRNDLKVLESRQPLRTTERMQLGDGEHLMLVVKFSVIGADGEPHLAGMAMDITQRMREEQELRESRTQLREAGDRLRLLSSAIEQSGDGVAIARPDGELEFVNLAFAAMHGLEVEDLLGRRVEELFSTGQDLEIESARRALQEAGEFRGELWHENVAGEIFPCHESHSLVRNVEGKVVAHVLVARDVSEAVAVEKRLQDAQALLEQRVDQRTAELAEAVDKLESEVRERKRAEMELERVWDSTLELLALMGEDGCFRRVNRTFERTLHVTQGEVVGRHFLELVADEDKDKAYRACGSIRESRPAPRFTVRSRVRVPGKEEPELRWLEWAVTPVEETQLVYAAARDVTELRNFEERTARQQAELAHASRLTSMGEMASGIAHELNQPLGAISLRAEACKLALQRACPGNGQLADDLDYVRLQAERAGEIIRRLRGFVAKREPERKWVAPLQLVQDVMHFVDTDCEKHRVQLQLNLDAQLPHVECDEIQIQQVILNLVRNGIEALCSEENEAAEQRHLWVHGQLIGEGQGTQLQIIVEDDGPGLSPKIGEHLFDPFFSTKSGGLGIGLSLSKSIVESHGGSLLAHPREPRGLRFLLSLPVHGGTARCHTSRYSGRSPRTEGRS
jgi:two-component system sensor kinase FixL